jgi:hypothetical protein
MMKLVAPNREAKMLAITRIVGQSQTLRARNQGKLLLLERAVFEGLREIWPKKENDARWRLVAMIAVGTLRLAVDAWIGQGAKRRLAKHVQEMFNKLKTEI